MLRSRRLDTRGVWLDSNALELRSKALRVGRRPVGILHAARQLYRLTRRSVEAREARNPRGSAEGIYLLAKAFPVGGWPIGILHTARQLYRLPGLLIEARKVRRTLNSHGERVFKHEKRCDQRDN
jgi:hypothetical protein